MAAFKSASMGNSKLCAVELEGTGRVILDMQARRARSAGHPRSDSTQEARQQQAEGKRPLSCTRTRKFPPTLTAADDQTDKPNWPDTEFPWRLRTEERVELAKAEEEEHALDRALS